MTFQPAVAKNFARYPATVIRDRNLVAAFSVAALVLAIVFVFVYLEMRQTNKLLMRCSDPEQGHSRRSNNHTSSDESSSTNSLKLNTGIALDSQTSLDIEDFSSKENQASAGSLPLQLHSNTDNEEKTTTAETDLNQVPAKQYTVLGPLSTNIDIDHELVCSAKSESDTTGSIDPPINFVGPCMLCDPQSPCCF